MSNPRPDPGAPPEVPDRPARPADAATMKRIGTLTGRFGLLLLATFLVSGLRLPFSAAAILFGGWAAVVGVQAITTVARAHMRTPLLPALVVGVVLTALMVVSLLASALLWPVETRRQQCHDAALTLAAQQRCEAEFAEEITSWIERLVPGAPPAGA